MPLLPAVAPRHAGIGARPDGGCGAPPQFLETSLTTPAPGRQPSPDFRAIFDASPNPYVLLAPDFSIVAANAAYLRSTGRTPAELLGRNIFEAFPGGRHDPGGQGVRELRASLERVRTGRVPDTLALIRYAIPRQTPAGEVFEDRFWSAIHTPLLDERGELAFILQHTLDVTELHRLREAAGAAGTVGDPRAVTVLHRAQEVQEANRMLDAERRHLRQLFEQAPGFMAVLAGPDHVFELSNDAYAQLVGRRDILGKPVRQALPEVAGQGFVELLDRVRASRQAFVGQEVRILLQRRPGAPPEERYLDFVYQPILEADGSVSGIFVQGSDVTERRAAEARQQLLLDELNHRVKNTLATVQSIAAQTARVHRTPEAFQPAFQARLIAVSHTHDALTRGRWEGAGLRDILEQEMRPHGADRVSMRGGPVDLAPAAAFTLGLALHELATNAAKYGALSRPGGRVEIDWAVAPAAAAGTGRTLTLTWTEAGGPAVAPPARRGFGSRLIEQSIRGQLGGEAAMEFAPTGLRCRLTVPLVAAPRAERAAE